MAKVSAGDHAYEPTIGILARLVFSRAPRWLQQLHAAAIEGLVSQIVHVQALMSASRPGAARWL